MGRMKADGLTDYVARRCAIISGLRYQSVSFPIVRLRACAGRSTKSYNLPQINVFLTVIGLPAISGYANADCQGVGPLQGLRLAQTKHSLNA